MTDARADAAAAILAEAIHGWSGVGGRAVSVAGDVLTARATELALAAPGAVSGNGSCRLLRALDGWVAISLPRPEDRASVPALLGEDEDASPWDQLGKAAAHRRVGELVDRGAMLGIAIAAVAETGDAVDLRAVRRGAAAGTPWTRPPRVVDLSSLWAGPLCGALLAEAGCDVTKIDTVQRPDTTRDRSIAFDLRLNGGKRRRRLDRDRPRHRAELRERVAAADVVVTSARPRGLASLGIADAIGGDCLHVAIGAHPGAADRIGFGDDCAAAGGLVRWHGDRPSFVGDALADPLTGLYAAAVALRALACGRRGRVPIALAAVAAGAARLDARR